MTIAVVTPTGNVGSRVVQLLVQAGQRPRVLARDAKRLGEGVLPFVDVAEGDLLDPTFLAGATAGCAALFWAVPEVFTAEDPLADMVRMGSHAATAVRENGIRRVVQISSVGAEQGRGAGLIDGLARNEEQLAATGAEVCVLRCGYFFTNLFGVLDDLRAGRLTTAAPPDVPLAWVDPRDVGEVAALRLLAPAAHDETAAAHGPTGASPGHREVTAVHGPADLSWTDVARTLTAALNREITLTVTDSADLRDGLLTAGLSPAAADGVLGMTTGLAADFTPDQRRDYRTTTPTSLAAWAFANIRPLL